MGRKMILEICAKKLHRESHDGQFGSAMADIIPLEFELHSMFLFVTLPRCL